MKISSIVDTVVAKPIVKMSRVATPAYSQKIRIKATAAKKQLQQQTTQPIATSNFFTSSAKLRPYLTGLGLVVGGYVAADYWRRRRQSQQLTNAEDVKNVLDANSNSLVYY